MKMLDWDKRNSSQPSQRRSDSDLGQDTKNGTESYLKMAFWLRSAQNSFWAAMSASRATVFLSCSTSWIYSFLSKPIFLMSLRFVKIRLGSLPARYKSHLFSFAVRRQGPSKLPPLNRGALKKWSHCWAPQEHSCPSPRPWDLQVLPTVQEGSSEVSAFNIGWWWMLLIWTALRFQRQKANKPGRYSWYHIQKELTTAGAWGNDLYSAYYTAPWD